MGVGPSSTLRGGSASSSERSRDSQFPCDVAGGKKSKKGDTWPEDAHPGHLSGTQSLSSAMEEAENQTLTLSWS